MIADPGAGRPERPRVLFSTRVSREERPALLASESKIPNSSPSCGAIRTDRPGSAKLAEDWLAEQHGAKRRVIHRVIRAVVRAIRSAIGRRVVVILKDPRAQRTLLCIRNAGLIPDSCGEMSQRPENLFDFAKHKRFAKQIVIPARAGIHCWTANYNLQIIVGVRAVDPGLRRDDGLRPSLVCLYKNRYVIFHSLSFVVIGQCLPFPVRAFCARRSAAGVRRCVLTYIRSLAGRAPRSETPRYSPR